jgi:4-amino-4-deoxy-L-arabinose transferase-like glycosyltransferase
LVVTATSIDVLMNFESTAPESPRVRWIFVALAVTVAAAAFLFTYWFWVPADPNVDENAYLVGGRMLALHGSPGFTPPDPYSLVGKMWIVTREGMVYPKYPLGVSLLVAAVLKAFGLATGVRAAYWISPVLLILALMAVFLLVREVAGSFAGLLAEIALAASPVVLVEAIDPDSHSTDLFCVSWGMLLLFRWWRLGKLRHATLAGLLLGYAVIVRYTEGLLLLPLGLVILFRLRSEGRRAMGQASVLIGCWLVAPALQLAFNLRALHAFTGYDATGESTAFSWAYFSQNWWMTVRQLFSFGLHLLLPVGVLGLAALWLRSRPLAAVLWAWLLPNLLLYTAYYFALENNNDNPIRFFMTVFPPLVLAAAWLLAQGADASRRRVLQPGLALVLVLVSAALGVRTALPWLRSDYAERLSAARAERAVLAHAPAGSVIFGPQEPLMALQFTGDYRLYGRNIFSQGGIDELRRVRPGETHALQPERAGALYELLKDYDKRDLARLQRSVAVRALNTGQRVFVILQESAGPGGLRFVSTGLDAADRRTLEARQVARWSDPATEWQLLEVTPAAGDNLCPHADPPSGELQPRGSHRRGTGSNCLPADWDSAMDVWTRNRAGWSLNDARLDSKRLLSGRRRFQMGDTR